MRRRQAPLLLRHAERDGNPDDDDRTHQGNQHDPQVGGLVGIFDGVVHGAAPIGPSYTAIAR